MPSCSTAGQQARLNGAILSLYVQYMCIYMYSMYAYMSYGIQGTSIYISRHEKTDKLSTFIEKTVFYF